MEKPKRIKLAGRILQAKNKVTEKRIKRIHQSTGKSTEAEQHEGKNMIEIFRPAQTKNCMPCKQCGEKVQSIPNTISLAPAKGNQFRWNFHNECFSGFRQQINKVNIFKVKERFEEYEK